MAPLCKCGTIREKLTASSSAQFPGRKYYNCQTCGTFDWADSQAKLFDTNAGPECKCGKASVQRTVTKQSPNKGRKFWCCANGRNDKSCCKFFEWHDDNDPATTNTEDGGDSTARTLFSAPKKRPALPGFATYLSDWKKVDIVQRMMSVDPKFMASYTGSRYDGIDVVGLWKIGNDVRREKYEAAKEKVMNESPKDSAYDIPPSYREQMDQLDNQSLDSEAGEVFLLHGTRPENLHGILFEGHDTTLSNNGNFGRGIYFAENAAKIDQYSAKDATYRKENELHEKIYTKCMHPKNVRYALICRVLLGRHVTTSNGKKRIDDGEYAFTTKDRSELAPLNDGSTPSSLIGVPGKLVRNFREFVVFDSDQVCVEYLVAYKRVRSNCNCGEKCIERTVVKQTENRGRKIHLCGQGKCSFMQMLPLCDCGGSASVKTSQSRKNPGKKFFSCCQRFGRGRCDFFEWTESSGYASAPNPHKRARVTP